MRLNHGSIRYNDPGSYRGRLEIFHNGEWGTVCGNRFDQVSADVVCQQLGYNRASEYGTIGSLSTL